MKGRRTMKHFKPMACILSSVVLLAAMSWSVFADDEPQAKIGDKTYSTFAEAVSAAAAGDTVTLLTDILDTRVEPANAINIDGAGHTISGNSYIRFPATGGSITKTNFLNIHNSSKSASPIYCGTSSVPLLNSFSVTDCIFKEVDWDAIQIMPTTNASITITGNVVEEKDTDVTAQRFIHIETNRVWRDFSATITENKMYGTTTQGNIECYKFYSKDKVTLSGNYIENTNATCILMGTNANVSNMIFPICSSDVDMIPNKYPAVEIKAKSNLSSYFFDSFADAANAVSDSDTICVYANEIEFAPITKSNVIVKSNKSDGSSVKITKWSIEDIRNANKITINNFEFTVPAQISGTGYTFTHCKFTGSNGIYSSYAKGTCTISYCDFDTTGYGIHFDDGTGTVNIKNSKIRGFNTFGHNLNINFTKCTFENSTKNSYRVCQTWGNMTIKKSTFKSSWLTSAPNKTAVGSVYETAVTDITGCTVDGGTMSQLVTLCGIENIVGVVSLDAKKDTDGKYISGTILGTNKDSYIADGFEAVDNGDGTYKVAEKKPGGVEITATDAYVDENSGLGNLRYITTATVGENATVEYFGTWFIPSDIFTNSGSSLNVTVQKNEAITNGQTYSADLLSIPADELGRQIIGVSFIKLSGRDDIISSAQKITTVAESEAK